MKKTHSGLFNVIVALACIFASISCNSVDADLKRDNPRDPKAPNFIQSNPTDFNVNVANGNIEISWEDVSDYNTGYVIEKAINDSSQFKQVERLPGDAEFYRDRSREIGEKVYYKISTVVYSDGTETIEHSRVLAVSIQTIHSAYWSVTESNNIQVEWSTEQHFTEGVLIQIKKQGESEYDTIERVDFTDWEDFDGIYEFSTDLETFNLDVRLTAFQYQGAKIVPIHNSDKSLQINNPENFRVTFINELETKVEWDNSVSFADYYQLKVFFNQSGRELLYELQPNEFSKVLNMEMETGRARYTLQAVNGVDRGKEQEINKDFIIRAPLLSYSSTDLSAVTLHFEEHWDGLAFYSAIIVERSVNGGLFETIAELPASQEQFIDTDLISSNTYTYKIRTLTVEGYEEIEVSNKNRYVPLDSREVEYIPNLYGLKVHFPAADRMVVYRTHFSNVVSTDLEVIDIENLNNSVGFDSGSDYFQSRVSPSTDRVVEFVDGSAFGEYDLKIWDLRNESLIRTISAAFVETNLTYIDALLDFSRDEKLIASAISNKDDTEIKIWNSETGDLSHTIEMPDKRLDKFRFNPERDEFIIVTTQGLYIYETESFGLIYELENPSGRSYVPMILSGNGKRLFLYNSRRVYTFDVEAKEILGFNELDSNIEHISTNIDGSELLVRTDNSTGIYDAASLELKYIMKFTYGHPNSLLVLDSKKDGSAVEIKPGHPESPAHVIKWERRDVWHMDMVRQKN